MKMPEILEFGNAFLIKTIEIAAVPTGGTLERVDLQQKKISLDCNIRFRVYACTENTDSG
jgi:hypothetical protein